MDWTVEPVSDVVTNIRIKYKQGADWEFKILVTSDRHLDSVHSNLTLQKKHLEQAKLGGWPVIDLGDIFDAMSGKHDKRRSRVQLEGIRDKEEYFDALVDHATEFLLPYKDNLAVLGLGNHETSVLKHSETHLLKRVVKHLNTHNAPTVLGAYSGWIRLLFEHQSSESGRRGVNVRYTHGSGGSSPVTKGVIKTNRRAVVYPDANIVLSGHTHDAWVVPIARERCSNGGVVFVDNQLHCSVPSYKDETTNQTHGYAVEKELAIKTTGAMWLKFWCVKGSNLAYHIKYDAERAK